MPIAKRPRQASTPPTDQVRAYFAERSSEARKRLSELRATIRSAAPAATESFGYGIPGFRLHDRVLVYDAAFKEHVSIYPISREFERANATALQNYATSGKGTLRFAMTKPIPKGLVKRVVLDRIRAMKVKSARKR